MRIVIDLPGVLPGHILSVVKILVRNRGSHEIIIALSSHFPATVMLLRRSFERLLPGENIRVWHSPGPEAVTDLLHRAFLSGLQPDIVLTAARTPFKNLPSVAFESISGSASARQIFEMLETRITLYPKPPVVEHANDRLKLAFVSPLPPEHTSVADYSAELLPALHFYYQIDVIVDQKRVSDSWVLENCGIQTPAWFLKHADQYDRVLYHFDNSAFHCYMEDLVRKIPGVICLHDFFLGQYNREVEARSPGRHHWTEELYKSHGYPAVQERYHHPDLKSVTSKYPCSFFLVQPAVGIVVHSDLFRDLVRTWYPFLSLEKWQTIPHAHTRNQPDGFARQYARAIENFYHGTRHDPRRLVHRLAAMDSLPADRAYLCDLAMAIAQNQPDPIPEKKLYIDISVTCRNDLKTGIERVARALVLELIQHPPPGYRCEPVCLTEKNGSWHYRTAHAYTLALLECPGHWLQDTRIEMQAGELLFCPDLTFDILVAAEKTGLFDRIRTTGVTLVFTIFDLLPLQQPHAFPAGFDRQFHEWLRAVCRVSHKVVCISRSVSLELYDWYATEPSFYCMPMPDIEWFHLGADLDASSPTAGLPENAGETLKKIKSRPSFLMVGTIEPRKGYLQAMAAFELLWRSNMDVNLVIVGKKGWQSLPDDQRRTIPEIVGRLDSHPERNNRLFWLEGISDQYLVNMYATVDCLISASEAEGFGLPLIEAARHRLPVIARDIPVFREVAGDHAFYFQGMSPEALADAVRRWHLLYQAKSHPVSDNMPWKTWRQSGEQLTDLLVNQL